MSVLAFKKPQSSVDKALDELKDKGLDTVLVIGRTPDKDLVWTWGGSATISESVGLLEVLKYQLLEEHSE